MRSFELAVRFYDNSQIIYFNALQRFFFSLWDTLKSVKHFATLFPLPTPFFFKGCKRFSYSKKQEIQSSWCFIELLTERSGEWVSDPLQVSLSPHGPWTVSYLSHSCQWPCRAPLIITVLNPDLKVIELNQTISLRIYWKLMEDAKYAPELLRSVCGSRTGVMVVMSAHWGTFSWLVRLH